MTYPDRTLAHKTYGERKVRGILAALIIVFLTSVCDNSFCETAITDAHAGRKAEDYETAITMEVIRKIELPKGYHEGLLLQDGNVWVNNGEGGPTWVVNLASGDVISEIKPVAAFSEGITAGPGGKYWITDWDKKKLYLVSIDRNIMTAETEITLSPARPAGVIWNGEHLYVVTWTRGLGTRYHLLKMDKEGNLLSKSRIKNIPEPSQLAWDGKDLWVSSWFNRRVYRVNTKTLETTGYFRSNIKNTTGIAWDGEYFWVTGTSADLYQIKVTPKEE
ncbi:MAG: glutaminyl-peptide cyclotransferase [Candidatus Omnitrophica bacterium]|nr:glutaminyl-peptide cyclotransferase [Candidatus Omnitrophota bacterium]